MSAINTLNHLINHPLNKHARLSAVKRFLKWQIEAEFFRAQPSYHG